MSAVPQDGGPPDLLPAAARALWSDLPMLVLGSVLVCAGVVAPLLVGAGITPFSLWCTALTAGPLWAGLVATTDEAVLGGAAGVARLLHNVRRHAGDGIRVASVPCATAGLTVLALGMHQQTGQVWLLAPLAVGCAGSVLTLLAAVPAVPLRVEHHLHGRELWWTAASLVAARPLVPLGAVALAALGVAAGTSLLASLLPLVAGPAALVVSAGVWTAAGQVGLDVPSHDGGT